MFGLVTMDYDHHFFLMVEEWVVIPLGFKQGHQTKINHVRKWMREWYGLLHVHKWVMYGGHFIFFFMWANHEGKKHLIIVAIMFNHNIFCQNFKECPV